MFRGNLEWFRNQNLGTFFDVVERNLQIEKYRNDIRNMRKELLGTGGTRTVEQGMDLVGRVPETESVDIGEIPETGASQDAGARVAETVGNNRNSWNAAQAEGDAEGRALVEELRNMGPVVPEKPKITEKDR